MVVGYNIVHKVACMVPVTAPVVTSILIIITDVFILIIAGGGVDKVKGQKLETLVPIFPPNPPVAWSSHSPQSLSAAGWVPTHFFQWQGLRADSGNLIYKHSS